MIKFQGSPSSDIEICGANFRPLPMFLNRQTIKILEDLGVGDAAFLKLQADAVEKLRETTESPINAANFLKRQLVGQVGNFMALISYSSNADSEIDHRPPNCHGSSASCGTLVFLTKKTISSETLLRCACWQSSENSSIDHAYVWSRA